MASGDCSEDDSSGSSSSNRINSPPSKKQRVIEETLVDRISELPDPLLVQILSLLPTKDAFSTSVLSKRWISLCTFVDSFSFTPSDFRKTVGSSFVEFVLAHSVSPKVKKLELDLYRGYNPDDSKISYPESLLVTRCLNFAVERNVENVVIRLDGRGYYLWPECFYTCSSLITLVLFAVAFDFDGVIKWNSLKSLKLQVTSLSDDEFVILLAGCPALETLELSHVGGLHRLEINSLKLKRLNLEYPSDRDKSLEIFAPYLQHLEISGNLHSLQCRLVDVSSVVNAKLTFYIKCIKDTLADWGEDFDDEEDSCHDYHQAFGILVRDNLEKLSTATELVIETWFTGALCMLLLKGVPIPELKCKYLTIESSHRQKFNLYGVAGLLRASPHVETLIIDMETWTSDESDSHCCFGLGYLAKGEDFDLQSWISSFVFPKLRKVQIVLSSVDFDMDKLEWSFDKLFKLSEFLLKTATVLEEFVIISKRKEEWRCSDNCVPMFLFKLAEKLLSCQRSSAKAMIFFKERVVDDEV